jgi:TfoX/Sxy family transcriptional regulator of competence genes
VRRGLSPLHQAREFACLSLRFSATTPACHGKRGAASPLLEKYSVPAQLLPLPEQMASVIERARELSQRDEDTSDARTRERPGNDKSSSG